MPIVSVWNNENNKWKRNAGKNPENKAKKKQRKEQEEQKL